ncbi:MAG: hypothetical protein J5605_05620, partial [Bacteroidales bacterium]|nr:hypothetical protein [Bacteroidales bacterium]
MNQNIFTFRFWSIVLICMCCTLQCFADKGDTLRISRTVSTIYPKENQYIGTDTVRFWWNKHTFTASYHLQIALDASFENIIVETNTTTNDTLIANL